MLHLHDSIIPECIDPREYKNADVESKDNEEGRTPFSWAVKSGKDEIVKLLLDKDTDIESKCNLGRTPLSIWAVC
jgi:ankyrin repeat protein